PGRQRSSAAFFATRQEEPAVFHQAGWRSPGGNDSGAASPLHHYTFELALRPDRLHGAGPHPDPVQLALERAPGQAAPGARPKPVFIACASGASLLVSAMNIAAPTLFALCVATIGRYDIPFIVAGCCALLVLFILPREHSAPKGPHQ